MGGEIDEAGIVKMVPCSLEIGKELHSDVGPIVQARSLQQFIRNSEAERANEIKRSAGCGARSRNVAGVLWYFRLVEKNLEHRANRSGQA